MIYSGKEKIVSAPPSVPDSPQYISQLSLLMRRAIYPSALVTIVGVAAGNQEALIKIALCGILRLEVYDGYIDSISFLRLPSPTSPASHNRANPL